MPTLTLQPSAGIDTQITSEQPTFNYGTSQGLGVGLSGSFTYRSLLKFDLSSVPTNIRITAVNLVLHCLSAANSSVSETVSVARSRIEWFEGASNGAVPGAGVNASTWNLRNTNGSLGWTGADWETSTDSETVTGVADYTFDVTNDVKAWVYGTAPNYGWFILAAGTTNGSKTFNSSDHATAGDRPELIITYDELVDSDTVTFQPSGPISSDTTIDSANPTINYGVSTTVSVSGNGTVPDLKTLIKFGEIYTLPANVTIVSATLRMYCTSGLTAQDISVHRGLTQWYGGYRGGSAALFNEANWTYRNAIATTAWGSAGGAAGTDYTTTPTDTTNVSASGVFYEWDVTNDVRDIYDGTIANNGWWLITTPNITKSFASADNGTPANRPQLVITYVTPTVMGSVAGTSTVTGTLKGKAGVAGTSAGTASPTATLISNEFSRGSTAGTATASGFLSARTFIKGASFGDSVAIADIKASYNSEGSAAGTSAHVADIKGIFYMEGSAHGSGLLTATPSFQGQLRGSGAGAASATAAGYARAVSKAVARGCNPTPLFYLTDGSVKSNGQLNSLNFLSTHAGYMLKNYRPQLIQYKEGGRWSSAPNSQGRRLRGRAFENAIDVLELSLVAIDQDIVIDFLQELIAFQEAAADYWSSEYPLLPVYLVAKAARETYTRYAVVHMMSVPELENPYAQPFFDVTQAAIETLTLRIERGPWLSTPPGNFECVEISSQRQWTVSGWQSGA